MKTSENRFFSNSGEIKNVIQLNIEKSLTNLISKWWNASDKDISHKLSKKATKDGKSHFPLRESPPFSSLEKIIPFLRLNMKLDACNFSQMHPPPLLEAVIASFLTELQNPNNVAQKVSRGTTIIERQVIEMLCDLLKALLLSGRIRSGLNLVVPQYFCRPGKTSGGASGWGTCLCLQTWFCHIPNGR